MVTKQDTKPPGSGINVANGHPWTVIKGDGTTIEITQLVKGKLPPQAH